MFLASDRMKKRLILIIALFVAINCFAQYGEDRYAFWQPNVKLTFEMFQGELPDSDQVSKRKELHLYHCFSEGLWSALDIPKTKRGWRKGMVEKYYFCAAMDKSESYFIVKDSTELKYAQLTWDVCEVATRIARKILAEFVNEVTEGNTKKVNGAISIQYMTCLNDGKQFGKEVTRALFDEVFMTHDEEAYLKFRTEIDELLEELQEYATTEEEIKRLTINIPDEGYILAPTLIGDFKERGEINY